MQCSFILQILSLGYMFYPLQALNMNMLKVKGRGDYMLTAESIKKVLGIVCVLILIKFNITVVVIGWTCCAIFEFLISQGFYMKLCRFSPVKSLKALVLTTLVSFTLSFLLSYVTSLLLDNSTTRFFIGGVAFVLIYLLK